MAKKKKVARTHNRRSVSRIKRNRWDIKRIFLPLGFAALAVLASSQLTYTQSFRSEALGDEDKTQEEQQKQMEEQQREAERNRESSQNSGSGSSGSNVQAQETETETPDGVKVKTKVEDSGATKVEIESEGIKFKFEEEDGELKLRVRDEEGNEIRTSERLRELSELEEELEDEEIEISSEDGELEIEHNAIRARTNFPLSIDPVTRELIVTTPAGEKTVAVLPDAAVANLLINGFLTRVASPSAGGSEATTSGTVASSVELKLAGNNLVYEVDGVKEHRVLGLIPVLLPRTVAVSARTGVVLSQSQSWLTGLIDLISL